MHETYRNCIYQRLRNPGLALTVMEQIWKVDRLKPSMNGFDPSAVTVGFGFGHKSIKRETMILKNQNPTALTDTNNSTKRRYTTNKKVCRTS